jgi:DNA-binding CsgD family transcriptional regulator
MGRIMMTETARMTALNLNDGQKDCLRLVMRHFSSKEIARQLDISPHTVDKRLKVATATLGVSSRVDAARILTEMEEKSGVACPGDAAESKQSAFFLDTRFNTHRDQSLVYQRPDLSQHLFRSSYQTSADEQNPAADKASFAMHENQAVFTGHSIATSKAGFLGLVSGEDKQVNDLGVPARMAAILVIAVGSILTFAIFISVVEGLSRLY